MAKKKKHIQETTANNENGQTEQLEVHTQTESEQSESVESTIRDDGQTFADLEALRTESENETQNIEPEPAKKVEEKEFDLNAIMQEFGAPTEGKRPRKPRKSKEQQPEAARVQMIIPGRLFVTVCDNAAISAIGALDSWISKKPINTDLLKLSEQQITDLSPLAEEAIKAMKLENDPISVYFGSLAAIYLSNYLQIRAMVNKMSKTELS